MNGVIERGREEEEEEKDGKRQVVPWAKYQKEKLRTGNQPQIFVSFFFLGGGSGGSGSGVIHYN